MSFAPVHYRRYIAVNLSNVSLSITTGKGATGYGAHREVSRR